MGDSGSEQEGLSRRQRAAALLVPLVLTALAYANSLHAEFEFDDYKSVVRHPAVRDISRISLSSFSPALTGQRPVTVLTFALNRRWAGLDVVPYHLTNLALHLLTVSLVYAFTRSTLRRAGYLRPTGMALAITGLFALHPLHSEAVTYIVQRGECLASLLYLAALLLLLRAEERGFTLRGVAACIVRRLHRIRSRSGFEAGGHHDAGGVPPSCRVVRSGWRRCISAFMGAAKGACGALPHRGWSDRVPVPQRPYWKPVGGLPSRARAVALLPH